MVHSFKNKFIKSIITMITAVSAFCPLVSASTIDVNTFSLKAVIPENQVDKKQTYFDLRLSPGEEQTIQVIVTNSEDYPINAYIDVNTATTGANGIILYNQENVYDSSQIYAIEDIAEVLEPQITIPGNSATPVDILLQMPELDFDGHLLGGIVVSADRADENEPNTAAQDGIQINNKFFYILGLKISGTDTPVEPEFNLISVEPTVDNYRSVLEVQVQNSEPVIIKGMDVNAQVYRGNSTEAFRDLNLNNVEMAPNSTGAFIVDWDNKAFEKGNYKLMMQIHHNGRTWEWEELFTVDSGTAKDMQENSIIEATPTYGSYIILGILILVVLLGIVYWLGRRSIAKRA